MAGSLVEVDEPEMSGDLGALSGRNREEGRGWGVRGAGTGAAGPAPRVPWPPIPGGSRFLAEGIPCTNNQLRVRLPVFYPLQTRKNHFFARAIAIIPPFFADLDGHPASAV